MKSRSAKQAQSEIGGLAEELEQDLGGIRRALRKPLDAAVAQGGLTSPQISVMRVVVRHHGVSLKDLSRAVSLAHSTVSGIVDRLEKRGMVMRRQDPRDGRVSGVYPTPAVVDFVQKEIPTLNRRPLVAAMERATERERKEIARAVRRLRELVDDAGR